MKISRLFIIFLEKQRKNTRLNKGKSLERKRQSGLIMVIKCLLKLRYRPTLSN